MNSGVTGCCVFGVEFSPPKEAVLEGRIHPGLDKERENRLVGGFQFRG